MKNLNILAKQLGYIIWKDESDFADVKCYQIFTIAEFKKNHGRAEEYFDTLKDCASFLANKIK
jgi:hypothetical protein